MIQIKDLKVKFEKTEVLKGINLNIKKGEVVALIGPSGTGKSTLLRCLNYLTKPTSGTITIDNFTLDTEKVTNKDIHNLRRKTAMVFQNYNLLKNKTAIENIMEPMITVQKINKKQAYDKAMKLIDKVGLRDKKDNYPRELSGGQQQRIGIARAMAVSSDVILFDEALILKNFLMLNVGLFILHLFFASLCYLASCTFNEIKYSVGIGAGVSLLFILIQ